MTTIAFALFNLPAFLTDPHPLGPPELNYLLVLIPYHVLLLIAIIAKAKMPGCLNPSALRSSSIPSFWEC